MSSTAAYPPLPAPSVGPIDMSLTSVTAATAAAVALDASDGASASSQSTLASPTKLCKPVHIFV